MRTQHLVGGLKFPEGTRWRDGRLWLSDIFNKKVIAVDLSGNVEVVAELDNTPSGLGFLADGTLLAALTHSRIIVRVKDQQARVHADLSDLVDLINDMVSIPDGTTYVGTGEAGKEAYSIVLVRPDGSAVIAASGVPRANGITVTPDQRHLIYAATDKKAIMKMDINEDGLLSNLVVFADLGGAVPDGMCLDEQGTAWVAAKDDGFIRVAEGGEVLERIPVEGGVAVTCVLGGDDRRTLFLAAKPGVHAALTAAVASGDFEEDGFVEFATVAVPGAGWP